MSSRNVKFEISLKELSVKFEGDIQTAERMQSQITGALNSLSSAQNKLLAPGQPATGTPAVDATPARRRRRRSKRIEGIDAAILEADVVSGDGAQGESTSGDGSGTVARRRRSGAAQTELLTRLKNDGFFSERRTISEIREALSRKGHTFESNEVSPILVSLTKKELLQREKNSEGQWLYYSA